MLIERARKDVVHHKDLAQWVLEQVLLVEAELKGCGAEEVAWRWEEEGGGTRTAKMSWQRTEKRKRGWQMATCATQVGIWWEHAHPGSGRMQRGLEHGSGHGKRSCTLGRVACSIKGNHTQRNGQPYSI